MSERRYMLCRRVSPLHEGEFGLCPPGYLLIFHGERVPEGWRDTGEPVRELPSFRDRGWAGPVEVPR